MVDIPHVERIVNMQRYVRVRYQGVIYYGIINDDQVELLEGNNPESFTKLGVQVPLSEVEKLIPCEPQKIICSGLNYTDTVLEEGAKWPKVPLIFLKPPTAMIGDGQEIHKNGMVEWLNCEAELGVVIGKDCKYVSKEQAMDYVWGYIAANDITAKDLQKADTLWTRAKSFDTFLPLSDEIVSGIDGGNLDVSCYINDQQVQKGNTRDLLFDISTLISFCSTVMTLKAGDIVITGTPGGYGKHIVDGDVVRIEIEKVGKVTNTVKYVDYNWAL